MLKLLPLEKSMPFPWMTALPLNLRVPAVVSTKSENLLKREPEGPPPGRLSEFLSSAVPFAGSVPALSRLLDKPAGMPGILGEAAGCDTSDNFKPRPIPLFAAKDGFEPNFVWGTAGAEIQFCACGRVLGGSLRPPGMPVAGVSGSPDVV